MMGKRKKIEKPFQSTAKEPKRNRSVLRPNAARKEKERLKAFNEALKNLQKVIPVKLPPGRKLHKKQTLQLACRYIHFLRGCLDGSRNWGDRSRFWCESDEDYSMIDAIDAAAVATSNKNHLQFEKKTTDRRNSHSSDDKLSPNFEIPFQSEYMISGLSQLSWMNQQSKSLKFDSHAPNFCRMQPSFISLAPQFYSLTQKNERLHDVTEKSDVEATVKKSAETQMETDLHVANIMRERFNEEDSENHQSSGKEPFLFAVRSEAHDQLDEAWKDLSEILFQ